MKILISILLLTLTLPAVASSNICRQFFYDLNVKTSNSARHMYSLKSNRRLMSEPHAEHYFSVFENGQFKILAVDGKAFLKAYGLVMKTNPNVSMNARQFAFSIENYMNKGLKLIIPRDPKPRDLDFEGKVYTLSSRSIQNILTEDRVVAQFIGNIYGENYELFSHYSLSESSGVQFKVAGYSFSKATAQLSKKDKTNYPTSFNLFERALYEYTKSGKLLEFTEKESQLDVSVIKKIISSSEVYKKPFVENLKAVGSLQSFNVYQPAAISSKHMTSFEVVVRYDRLHSIVRDLEDSKTLTKDQVQFARQEISGFFEQSLENYLASGNIIPTNSFNKKHYNELSESALIDILLNVQTSANKTFLDNPSRQTGW